ncbi:MAG: PilZ domain-containing protein [candidate division Zixibacteria bacterium]|nr:PilZ domain-containing protein [candidate division Zixibacteria bacterium]
MNDTPRTRFINDVEVTDKTWQVRKPFRVSQENQRSYIRLEISTPMTLRKVRDMFGNFWPTQEDYHIDGEILNISPGGVLADLNQPVNENDVVALRFSLQDVETIDSILGLVKRVDQDDDTYLAGIQFISREQLEDRLSEVEIELLSDSLNGFDNRVDEVIKRYLVNEGGINRE